MTRLSYDVIFNDTVVFNVISYPEAKKFVESKGAGWKLKKVYTDFDPDDTPEKIEEKKQHAKKVAEYRRLKKLKNKN